MLDHLIAAGITPSALDSKRWVELRDDDLLNGEVKDGLLSCPGRPQVPVAAVRA